jgi:hypothetical protein
MSDKTSSEFKLKTLFTKEYYGFGWTREAVADKLTPSKPLLKTEYVKSRKLSRFFLW